MLKFLLGNAKTRNASVPIGVASDNLINFSPVRSPRNRHAEKKRRKNYLQGKEIWNYTRKNTMEKIYLASKLYVPNIFLFTKKKYPECILYAYVMIKKPPTPIAHLLTTSKLVYF